MAVSVVTLWSAGSRECEDVGDSVHCVISSEWWQHCHSTADGHKRLLILCYTAMYIIMKC